MMNTEEIIERLEAIENLVRDFGDEVPDDKCKRIMAGRVADIAMIIRVKYGITSWFYAPSELAAIDKYGEV